MPSGSDLRQALDAGLWEALADGSDRAAMRATCRDARDVADALHDTAVLPVGPGTWESGCTIAAYHCQLGAVRSVHVRYSGGAQDEARAAHFIEAYSAALGAALPATDCSIEMPYGRQLPAPLAAALLQRVVPRVERLDMTLGSYGNVEQLLQALEPCARLCSLKLLPMHAADEPSFVEISFQERPGALDALCRLPRLHTLSGPWEMEAPHLQCLCDALPSLTTLGFRRLSLQAAAPGTCISRRLHTLAAWCHSAGHESLRLDEAWQLQDSNCRVDVACNLPTALPAVRHLDALVLETLEPVRAAHLPAIHETMVRCAACADRWAWRVAIFDREQAQRLQAMPPGSLAALKHLVVEHWGHMAPADIASATGGLVSAAPNISTLLFYGALGAKALEGLVQPLRRATCLRTLWLPCIVPPAPPLEGVVRGLAWPGAEGGDEYCRALRHVLLAGAQPDAIAACRAALARDGICVSVGACAMKW